MAGQHGARGRRDQRRKQPVNNIARNALIGAPAVSGIERSGTWIEPKKQEQKRVAFARRLRHEASDGGRSARWRSNLGEGAEKCHRTAFFRSEEHTSELKSLMRISYAVFCLKKKKQPYKIDDTHDNNPIPDTTNIIQQHHR